MFMKVCYIYVIAHTHAEVEEVFNVPLPSAKVRRRSKKNNEQHKTMPVILLSSQSEIRYRRDGRMEKEDEKNIDVLRGLFSETKRYKSGKDRVVEKEDG